MSRSHRMIGLACGAACFVFVSTVRAQLPSGMTWALRFADEFNETYAGNIMGLDPDKWSSAYPWGRTHNYPAYIRDENILVNTTNNGLLQLWGKRESFGGQPFTSGAVNTNGHLNLQLTGQSGYMEARIKMPNFLGAWPAFWSLQDGWPPEIDTMEFVRNGAGSPNTSPNNYVANVHFSTPGGNSSSWSGFKDAGAGDLTAGFHNYGVRWTDSTLTWYIDGRQFHSYAGADAIAQMQHMYLILNLGIGGWPGDPPATEDVNKSFDVDWVRVWLAAPAATQSDYTGGSGNQNWDLESNWTNGAPKLAGQTAFFGSNSTSAGATLDWTDTKVVRGLTFRTGSNYRIGSTDDLLMVSTWGNGGSSAEAVIDVQVNPNSATQGTQIVNARLELFSNLRVKNATTSVIGFLGDVHGAGALTLDSGKSSFNTNVYHRGGTNVVGSADASFFKTLGTPDSSIYVGTTAGSTSTLRVLSTATTVQANHLRIGDAGGAGSFLQSGGAVTISGGETWVGQAAGSSGTYSQSAGSLTVGNWLAIGRQGGTGNYLISGNATLNKNGLNNIIIGSLGGVGTFTQTGGTVLVQAGNTLLGEDAGGAGTYTITGGSAVLGDIILSQRATGSGVFNLNGGSVTANRVSRVGTGGATLNLNGGLLRAAVDGADLVGNLTSASVRAGGAIIDTNGLNVRLSQPLLHDATLGSTADGGLIKTGAGGLTLLGGNTYTGLTTLQAGALVLSNAAQPPVLAGGGADVQAGRLVFDYTGGGGGSPAATVPAQLADAYTHGFLSGQIRSTTATPSIGLGWMDDSSSMRLTIARAYFGDADLNGTVNGLDFAALAANFGSSDNDWAHGDFNYDGTVNSLDFGMLATNFGQTLPGVPVPGNPVPEPALAGAGLLTAMSTRPWRRRRGARA